MMRLRPRCNAIGQASSPDCSMKLSLSAISTVNASFAEDVEAYAAAGFDAIGLWEMKLPDDDAANGALLAEHGLAVSNCIPTVPSSPPARDPGHGRPGRPRDADRRDLRVDPASRRLRAGCVVCLERPARRALRDATAARIVIDGLRRAARARGRCRASGSASSRSIPPSATLPASSRRSPTPSRCSTRRARQRSGSWPTRSTSGTRRPTTSSRQPGGSPGSTSRTSSPEPVPASARSPGTAGGRPRSSVLCAPPAGTARSTSRSSRLPTTSGRCRRTRPPAGRTRASSAL